MTADALESKINISLPEASATKPPSANLGAVRVFPENVSVPVRVASVPVVGKVTLESAEVVSVTASAPASVSEPPSRVSPVTVPALPETVVWSPVLVPELLPV